MKSANRFLLWGIISVIGVICGMMVFFHIEQLSQFPYKQFIKAMLGLFNVSLIALATDLFYKHKKVKKLDYALSSEMGFIARAVFYVLSGDKIKAAELAETFTVTNAVIHSVGVDIALLDKRTSQNILEFHSLMKVVINTLETSGENMNEKLNHLFFRLVETVCRNQIAKNIVESSWHAKMGLLKAEREKVNLI